MFLIYDVYAWDVPSEYLHGNSSHVTNSPFGTPCLSLAKFSGISPLPVGNEKVRHPVRSLIKYEGQTSTSTQQLIQQSFEKKGKLD